MSSQLSKQPDTPNKSGQAKFRRIWLEEGEIEASSGRYCGRGKRRGWQAVSLECYGQLDKEATCLSVSRRWAKARSVRQDTGVSADASFNRTIH